MSLPTFWPLQRRLTRVSADGGIMGNEGSGVSTVPLTLCQLCRSQCVNCAAHSVSAVSLTLCQLCRSQCVTSAIQSVSYILKRGNVLSVSLLIYQHLRHKHSHSCTYTPPRYSHSHILTHTHTQLHTHTHTPTHTPTHALAPQRFFLASECCVISLFMLKSVQ